jgi:phosphate transport system substrate-binding protein
MPVAKGDGSKMTRRRLGLAAALSLALLTPASASAKTLIGSGSTTAQPYLQALFQGYRKVNPSIQFIYTGDGGNAGVKDVQAGRSQFAAQSRPPLPSDAGTTYVKLFLDGLCVDVNSRNRTNNLSVGQTSDIFTGVLTNWGLLPGSGLSSTIDAVGRDSTSGSFTFFTAAILNGKTQGSNVNTLASDGLIANAVRQDPNSIGYVGLAYQKNPGLKALSLNGIPCADKNIKTLQYPLSRFIWLVLPTASPDLDVQKFADWVRTSVAAGEIIKRGGAVPAFNKTKPKKRRHKR